MVLPRDLVQVSRHPRAYILDLFNRRGQNEVPADVWIGFQRQAYGLLVAYFATLLLTMFLSFSLLAGKLREVEYSLRPWILMLATFGLQATIEAMSLARHKLPDGHLLLMAHAAVHGLVWGLLGSSTEATLLLQLVFVLLAAWVKTFQNVASTGTRPEQKDKSHITVWISGWLVGCMITLAVSLVLGVSPILALIVGVEALLVKGGMGEWGADPCMALLQESQFDDAELVVVSAVKSLLVCVHLQLGTGLLAFWS